MSGRPEVSPLGRYTPDTADARLVTVELRRLPLRLLIAGREHHDGLLREFRLLALDQESTAAEGTPARFLELVSMLGSRFAAARERRDEEIDDALRRGDLTIDQVATVPETAAGAVTALRALMEEADDFCNARLLLTLSRPPLLKQFSDWYFDQFVDQIAGRPPRAWDGPLEL